MTDRAKNGGLRALTIGGLFTVMAGVATVAHLHGEDATRLTQCESQISKIERRLEELTTIRILLERVASASGVSTTVKLGD